MTRFLPGLTTRPAPGEAGPPAPCADLNPARRRADFARWHWLQQNVGDSDPNYPVLKSVGAALGGKQATADLLMRMLAFYDIGSAIASAAEAPRFVMPDRHHKRFKIGQHARGNRHAPRFHRQWASLLDESERYGGPVGWFTPSTTGAAGWREMEQRAQRVHGLGRYFGYKVAEFSQVVMGADIAAPDASHKDSTSVRKGLAHLFPYDVPQGNSEAALAKLDAQTRRLATDLQQTNLARLETALCSIKTAIKGRCYIGWEIDEQHDKLLATRSDLTPAAFAARANYIDPRYLGELNGWRGVDRDRLPVYRDTGVILTRGGRA